MPRVSWKEKFTFYRVGPTGIAAMSLIVAFVSDRFTWHRQSIIDVGKSASNVVISLREMILLSRSERTTISAPMTDGAGARVARRWRRQRANPRYRGPTVP